MIRDIVFRTLMADEIECRPQGMGKDYPDKEKLLLYMDSRVVVNLLNETVGNLGWQTELGTAGGQMVGKLGIRNPETGEWVWKSDTGSESNIEAEKGQVSDIYKRLLARWGVKELYTAPYMVFQKGQIKEQGFKVSEIEYNERREITHLRLVNRYGKQVFVWDKDTQTTTSTPTESTTEEKKDNHTVLYDFCIKKAEENPELQGEIKKFFNYWKKKAKSGWKGKLEPEKLWKCWTDRIAA